MKSEFVSRFTLSQVNFNRARALENTRMLVAHANMAYKMRTLAAVYFDPTNKYKIKYNKKFSKCMKFNNTLTNNI